MDETLKPLNEVKDFGLIVNLRVASTKHVDTNFEILVHGPQKHHVALVTKL